jgi:RNA polymerase sigma factor (sigma-70 family)
MAAACNAVAVAGHAGGVTEDDTFGALYAAHYDDLLRYALRRVEQPADAADVVAETWAVAWRRRHDLPPAHELRLWLFGTARRVLANHRRGRLRQSQLAEKLKKTLHLQTARENLRGPDDRVSLALSRLSERDREVLFLSAWEDLPPEDIAKVLGCTAATARVRLHRARSRFKEALGEPPERVDRTHHQPLQMVEEAR